MKTKTIYLEVPVSENTPKDICVRCGSEYYDTLGIGLCPKCFYGTKYIDRKKQYLINLIK